MNEQKSKNVKIGVGYVRSSQYGEYISLLLGNTEYEVVLRSKTNKDKVITLSDRFVNLAKNNFKQVDNNKSPDYVLNVSRSKRVKAQ